jgi:hypothetical protein
MRTRAIAILASIALAGCQSISAPSERVAFDATAASYIHAKGSQRIEGQAYVVTRDGSPRPAANGTVRLVPATAYAKARFEALYQGKKFIPAAMVPAVNADPHYAAYTRMAKTDANGNFRFLNVAPGDYFITAQEFYSARGTFLPEGGAMYESVSVAAGGPAVVDLVLAGRCSWSSPLEKCP